MASADAMKAFDKGKNSGSMFRLDLDVMKADKMNAESYVRLWTTAWHSKLTNEELEIARNHTILWFGEQMTKPNGYPPNGIPGTTAQTLALANSGKVGDQYTGKTVLQAADELAILSSISGTIVADAQTDYYAKSNDIRKAMEHFRHYATVALGPKLSAPFDRGLITSYDQLIKWVYKKCNVTKSMESMADYFEELDKAIHDDSDTDCCSLKYRMVLEKLFQTGSTTTPIPFPDIEGDSTKLTEKEKYLPSHAFMFIYTKWKAMDKKSWTTIEDEFRGEIGGTNYNKANWMLHKPRLFELIDQKAKNGSSRASINKAQVQEDSSEDEERMEIEIEPGLIMYVSPKNKKVNRTQNWKSKVQKYAAAAKRGQKPNNGTTNRTNNQNWNNQQPATHWNCRMCPTQNGKVVRHQRGQKCPKNGFIPQRMVAMVQAEENETAPKQEVEQEKEEIKTVRGQIASARSFHYDSSSTDEST